MSLTLRCHRRTTVAPERAYEVMTTWAVHAQVLSELVEGLGVREVVTTWAAQCAKDESCPARLVDGREKEETESPAPFAACGQNPLTRRSPIA